MAKKKVEVEVTKLTLKIDEKTIELTIDQAKKLHENLKELFEKEVIIQKESVPNWWINYPWWRPETYYGEPDTQLFKYDTNTHSGSLTFDAHNNNIDMLI